MTNENSQTMAFYEVAGGTDELIDDVTDEEAAVEAKQWVEGPRASNKPSESVIKDHIGQVEFLLESIPDSADFLKSQKYGDSKRRWFSFRKSDKSMQLQEIVDRNRRALNSYVDNRKIDPRREINRSLQKYNNSADLHALHAIYMFNASSNPIQYKEVSKIATNKLDENRFKNLKKCLQEIIYAVLKGSTCIYSVNWLIQIYNEYLSTLHRMMRYRHSEMSSMGQSRFDKGLDALYTGQIKVISMLINRDELNSFKALSRKLANTGYIVENFDPKDIEKAAMALESDPRKPIIGKMNANNIIVILMTTLLLLAKIPIFRQKKLVANILAQIPVTASDLEIRKRVVETSLYMTDFKLAVSVGDVDLQKKTIKILYDFCRQTISEFVSDSVSSKWHADQVLRIAWIALSSQKPPLFEKSDYKELLRYAYQLLGRLVYHCTIDTKGKDRDSQIEKTARKQKLIDEAILSRAKIQDIGREMGLDFDSSS